MRRALAVLTVLLAGSGCATVASGPQLANVSSHVLPAAVHSVAAAPGRPHIFLIVLENESYADTYLDHPNRYIGKTLERQGTLLTQYHAIGHFSLDNYIAMISGQAPNPSTSADCQEPANFNKSAKPAVLNASGQAVGTGCVYPKNVLTLANQLSARGISWGGYMEDLGNTPSREQKRCGRPTLEKSGFDETQEATAKDQYAARHNPFVYFHSLIDSGLCRRHVVALRALPGELRRIHTTRRFNFITPDLCDDGHDSPCAGKDSLGSRAGGLVSANHFLSVWIPRIESSPAYRENGLIIITSDESALSDTSSCCGEKPGPDEKLPGLGGPGGGRIGTLVIGKCVRRGAKDPTPYNHYSLLRSLEDLYRITTGGTDGHGHLGYAAAKGLRPFGADLFATCTPT
jgi:phosphatidylinositol-3-phosphatase